MARDNTPEWADQAAPHFEGKLVEIHGLTGSTEARDGHLIYANGKRGRALWDEEHSTYAIHTFDGSVVDLPGENLREFVPPKPDDGGFDYAWPSAGYEEEFSVRVADTIRKKGYVVIQMFEADHLRLQALQAAKQWPEFTLPKQELEEAYLGRNASSKLAMIRQGDALDESIEHYDFQVKQMATALFGLAEDFFGFRPDNYRFGTMIRMPLQHPGEREMMNPGSLEQADVDAGLVEGHLDFIQRRRLCIMYLVDNKGGTLEFHPKEDLCQQDVHLPLTRGKIVAFRHDLMGYTYTPRGSADLVVQSWFMEEQQKLRLDSFKGDHDAVAEVLGMGGIPIDSDRQVHIMGGNMRMPGGCYQMDRYWSAFAMQVDGFIDIPKARWDMDPYYNADSEQFGAQGKSVTRHAGLMGDDELMCFDNQFFNISPEAAFCMASTQRILLEISFELMSMVGFPTLRSLKNQNIGLTVAECNLDMDVFHGFQQHPTEWLEAQFNFGTSAARVAMMFGTTGPLKQVDTACSSSLVSHNISHAMMRKHDNKGIERMFSMGHQTIIQPWPFLGMSGAGMLGRTGRCLTFDQSGNGMARAEGIGGLFLKVSDDPMAIAERLGVYVSSFINQDGRSASLTAPNGPSQQLCMRASMKDGQVGPADVTVNESHGTGTALGDPIETGSVRAVFRQRGDIPISVTSSKSNLGHEEATAGSNGLLRTLTSLLNGTIPSTVHVRQLNQHIEFEGFPGAFPTECIDMGKESNIGGLNSFGFGGTNSRAELWGHALQGPRAGDLWFRQLDQKKNLSMSMDNVRAMDSVSVTCPRCLGPMCWLCGMAMPMTPHRGKHHCSSVRKEHASYELCSNCFGGAYNYGGAAVEAIDRGDRVYVAGSWSSWASLEEMQPSGDGIYTLEFAIGDTCLEQFHLVLERDPERAIIPVAKRASSRTRMVGPTKAEAGKNWLVDGCRDGAQTGSIYQIRFEWTDSHRRIFWEKMEGRAQAEARRYPPRSYRILSSLTGFRPAEMQRSSDDPTLWQFQGKFTHREELFMFQRDRDPKQLIYPLVNKPLDPSVPVVGPDAGLGPFGDTRLWQVKGKPDDIVMISLRVKDGDITVTAISETTGQTSWHKAHGGARDRYFLKASWHNWLLQELEPDMADQDVYKHFFNLPPGFCEQTGRFQIVVNKDLRSILHPDAANARPGQALAVGPDAEGEGLLWEVNGPPGQAFELVLDLGAEDARRTVVCKPCRRLKGLPA